MDAWVGAAMDVAAKQNGLISWHELRASGATEKNIAGAVERGWLARDQRGVYAVSGAPRTWRRRIHAAVLSAGGLAAVSHSSAATLWEFKHLPYFSLEIVVTAERHID